MLWEQDLCPEREAFLPKVLKDLERHKKAETGDKGSKVDLKTIRDQQGRRRGCECEG